MFAKLVTLASLAILAAATGTPSGSCPTSGLQCCSTTTTASNPAAVGILQAIGVVLQDLNVGVGLGCSPITVVGVGSGACSSNTVYCEDNSHGHLISIGCLPITL